MNVYYPEKQQISVVILHVVSALLQVNDSIMNASDFFDVSCNDRNGQLISNMVQTSLS